MPQFNTPKILDINPGSATSEVFLNNKFIEINGTIYFRANDGTHGNELYKIDSGNDKAELVSDINIGSGSSFSFTNLGSQDIINLKNTLYFVADDGIHGEELWRIDPTSSLQPRLIDINLGIGSSSPRSFIEVSGVLYFIAGLSSVTQGIYKIDPAQSPDPVIVNISTPNLSNPFDRPLSFSGKPVKVGDSLYISATNRNGFGVWSLNLKNKALPNLLCKIND
jgi:ELWxxDGT repeat protein